jgi:methionyl-tRNA formyltransferase
MSRVFLIASHSWGVGLIDELLHAGDEIVGVVAGKVTPVSEGWYAPPEYDVSAKAIRHFLPLYVPKRSQLNSPEFLEVIRKARPDYVVSGYYAKIFSDDLLNIPKHGCVNLHPAKLPDLRGLTPHFSHIILGDSHNWATMHWLDADVDTGDIIARASIEIKPEDTGFESGRKLTEAGMAMFREYWPQVKGGTAPRIKQDDAQARTFNFSWKLAQIDWRQSATQVWNVVRTLTRPLGGAWTLAGGHKMHVWAAHVVHPDEEMNASGALPGQVLAMTGGGMWVQCGQGQLRILKAALDDRPDLTPFELLASWHGKLPLMLG